MARCSTKNGCNRPRANWWRNALGVDWLANGDGGGSGGGGANLIAPVILGNGIVGQDLTVQPGSWSIDGIYTYQWQRNGVDISGSTAKIYTVQYADEGTNITVVETVSVGNSASSNSVSVPVVFGRTEVLDAVLPSVNATITSGKVSALNSLKGTMAFTQGTDANRPTIVQLFSGKAFKSASGVIRLVSAAAFPQQNFSAMALVYGSNGSVFSNKNGTGFINFNITGNLVVIANTGGTVLTGDNSLTSNNTIRTAYWNYGAAGFAVGNDGDEDLTNATVISSAPSGSFHILNGNSGANAFQLYVGAIVWFTRALDATEQDFWSKYLKSRWLYGHQDLLPSEGNALDSIGNVESWLTDVNGWNANSAVSTLKSYNTTTKTLTKGAGVIRIENPQKFTTTSTTAHESKFSLLANATSTPSTRVETLSQPFTKYFTVCIAKYLQPGVTTHKIFEHTNGSDIVTLYVDAATGKFKMQSQGAVGSSGIEVSSFQYYKWAIVKAVFNGASSSLTVDYEGTETTTNGSLGGTTGLNGTVNYLNNISGFIGASIVTMSAVPTSDQNISVVGFLRKKRSALPRYDLGSFIQGDTSDAHRAFGGITKKDGVLNVIYRFASTHTSADGVLKLSKSTDDGATWSTEQLVYSPGGSLDARDPRIFAASDGRLHVNFFTNPYPSQSYTIYSDDDGATWSSPVEVAPDLSYYDLRTSGYIIQQSNGDLLLPCHTEDIGTTNLKVLVFRSTTNGASWAFDSEIASTSLTYSDFEEFNIRILANGSILGLIRVEENTPSTLRQIHSVTGTLSGSSAITWGTPALAINGAYGSPGFIQDSSGRIHLTCRLFLFDFPGAYFYSDDNGATWTQGEFPEPHFDYWVYGAPIQLDDGRIGILWFQQQEASAFHKTIVKFRIL